MTVEELKKIGISCRELADCKMYNVGVNTRGTYEGKSPANIEAAKHDGLYGIQCLMNKIRRAGRWNVSSLAWDSETKSFDAAIVENSKVKEVKHLSYEDICKFMWWKSFKVVGPDAVKPVPMTLDERNEIERPLVEATNRRMKKWLAEHPEEAAKLEAEKAEASKSHPEASVK